MTRQNRIGRTIRKATLTAATLAVLVGAATATAQQKRYRGGTYDLAGKPAPHNKMRDFHVKTDNFTIDSVEVWKVDADGNEVKINWPSGENHGGSDEYSYGSDQDEAADQKIKWRVCSSTGGSTKPKIDVWITQDGNVDFNFPANQRDARVACSVTPQIDPDTGGVWLVAANGAEPSDGPCIITGVEVFMIPNIDLYTLETFDQVEGFEPLPPDVLNPIFVFDQVQLFPGDEMVINLFPLEPLPPDVGYYLVRMQEANQNVLFPGFKQNTHGFQLPVPQNDCPGDTNGDGFVDLFDLNAVLAAFGQPADPNAPVQADLNGDGFVDLVDLNEVLANFGANCADPAN